jgi:CBS domain-containing protein
MALTWAKLAVIAGLSGITGAGSTGAFVPRSGAETSCFLDSITHTRADTIERATIFLAVVRGDGSLLSEGTGFVVQGSGGSGPRIVTAAHVVDTADDNYPADAELMAFFSDGSAIGRVGVLVSGLSHEATVEGMSLVLDDVAVAGITAFTTAASQARFQQIEGLAITVSNAAILVGEASEPVAVAWGFSGAPAVDAEGRVIGVVTGADFRGRVTVELGSIADTEPGRPAVRKVTLPSQSLVVVEPLNPPEILQALGPTVKADAASEVPVVIAGYPLASCAATATALKTAESSAGAALLAKWRGVGPTGAWLLPPKLGVMRLAH